MDSPTIDFVGESADKIRKKRPRGRPKKSSLPDSANPPRKKRKTKPKLSTNVPSSANMDKSSQIPSTPTPTPPMFPPHGIHGHGHVQYTPPSMMIPGIISGPVQSEASPSSRQVMDMSPHPYSHPYLHPYHQVPQFNPQHMQSGNYPYQSTSPVASQPRPPPQQQPHPLTHGFGHGDLQAYNVGAQIPLPPQANMLLGSSSQGSASSPTTQNVQGHSGHLVGQNQNVSESPPNTQANLLDNAGAMKIFTGDQNINGAAMTPQQSREKAELSPLADYKFEYDAPKDPNEYAEYQTALMKGMQGPHQPQRPPVQRDPVLAQHKSKHSSSSSGPAPSAPPFFDASSFTPSSPWPPSSGPSSFGAPKSGVSQSGASMSRVNVNNTALLHQSNARPSGASMPVITSNTMAAPQQYLQGQPPMQMVDSNNMAAQQQHFNYQPSGASMPMVNWDNIYMAAQRPQIQGQSFQPTMQMGNSSQQQHFSAQPSGASRPVINSNNMAAQQPQIHCQSFQPAMQTQMGNSNNMVTQQHFNAQPSGASISIGNTTNMAARQQQVQGQPFQPAMPTVKLNDLEPVSASNPQYFTFEELQTLDLLSRITQGKLQAGREPESWERCSQYFRQYHKWSPDIQTLQTLHQRFLADNYYYYGGALRGIPGFVEPPPGQGPSREVLNFLPGAIQGWDMGRRIDQSGNLVRSEWASRTDNIVAQTAAEMGLQWDLPNINGLKL
jgi:hypothetical protein